MKKFVVAIDPFSKPSVPTLRAMKTIRSLASQSHAKLQSVAVVSPELLDWPRDFTEPVAELVDKAAVELIRKRQKQLKVKFDESPETIMQVFRSTRGTMQAVRNFANASNADVIAVLTNVKTNQSAFGFVSSLVSTSNTPVLAVNAKGPVVSKVKIIVFASDYSDDCKKAYIKTLDFAKEWGARIIVVSKLYTSFEYSSVASTLFTPAMLAYEPMLAQEEAAAEREAQQWQKIADLKQVKVDFEFTRKSGTVTDNILRIAKLKKADLIVVVAQTGKYASIILGSITRQLLAKSKTPVLVMRDAEENILRQVDSSNSAGSSKPSERLAPPLL